MLEELDLSQKIKKQEFLNILKKEASETHITDLMNFHGFLVSEGKYVQQHYRKEYVEDYVTGFIMRIRELKEDNHHYEGYVDRVELKKALKTFKLQENEFEKFAKEASPYKVFELISLYTTFVLDEPIHMVGTLFPGGFRVKYENKIYYCPVKEGQKDNPRAVCGFCIAIQDEDV